MVRIKAFRAFHAMQADLRAPDGFPTRALHGFYQHFAFFGE